MTTATAAPASTGSAAAARPSGPSRVQRRRRTGFLFVLPYLLLFAVFMIWPILYGVGMSTTDRSLTSTNTQFVGLANYGEALRDPVMWSSLGNTLFFTVISTIPLVVVAFVMAYLVSTGLRGQWLWRLAFFAPYIIPVSVVTTIFGYLFTNDFGLFNGLLLRLGLDQVPWLSEPRLAMWSIALVTVWWTVGFNFLLYLTALQAIPDHLYEAAQLDGAGMWQRLFRVTLPLMRPTTVLVVLLQILASLKVFDQIFLLTAGGPDGATRSIIQYIYDVGFTGYRLGYGAAISYIFFALIVIVSLSQVLLLRRGGKEKSA